MRLEVRNIKSIFLKIISEKNWFFFKKFWVFVCFLPSISFCVKEDYYIDKHLEAVTISSSAFYKTAIDNIIKDASGANIIYNTNSASGSSKKVLTLYRAEEILKDALIINKEINIKPILNILEENPNTLGLIHGLLKTTSKDKSIYGGDFGTKIKDDAKNAFLKIKENSKDDDHIKKINYDIAKIYSVVNSGGLPFNDIIEYAEFQELITRVIHSKKHIIPEFFASEDESLRILIDFIKKDFVKKLPKIASAADIRPIDEIANDLIRGIEKELYYQLNKNISKKMEFIKHFLFHVEKICQVVSDSSQSVDELYSLIPNTVVSASRVSMDIIEMVEANIKKRLSYMQDHNTAINPFVSNMWLQPSYIQSTRNSKILFNRFVSHSSGISLGIEDSWYNRSNINLGFSYCYVSSIMKSKYSYKTELISTSNVFSSYFSLVFYGITADIQSSYISSKNNRKRIDPTGYTYKVPYESSAISVEITTSKSFNFEGDFIVKPKLVCYFSQYRTMPYIESSGVLLFNIHPNKHYNFGIGIETTACTKLYIYNIDIRPELFLGIKIKLMDPNKSFTISLYNDDYQITEKQQGKVDFKAGLGVLAKLRGVNLRIDYGFKKENNIYTHIINGNLVYFF